MSESAPNSLQESAGDLPRSLLDESTKIIQPVPVSYGYGLSVVEANPATTDFPSPGSKTEVNGTPVALDYPGRRPEGSFSLSGGQVTLGKFLESAPIVVVEGEPQDESQIKEAPAFYVKVKEENGKELVWNIDDLLEKAGALKMEDRIPVITFGSNANPGQLALKMEDPKLEGADKYIVPTLKAHVKGMAPVYVARIGINGYTFTDLVPTNDPNAKTEVYVNFLSRPQLEAVNATEGAYSLCELPDVSVDTADSEGIKMPAYLYVGRADSKTADILTDEQGRPIRLSELKTEGEGIQKEFASMSQPEVQRYIAGIARAGVAEKLVIPVEALAGDYDLVRLVVNRNKDERLKAYKSKLEPEELKRFGGVLTQDIIQRTIKESGRTTSGTNIRSRIPADNLDKSIDDVRTFSELIQSRAT